MDMPSGGTAVSFPDDEADRLGDAFRIALIHHLRENPDSYGLRSAVTQHAVRFIEVTTELVNVPWVDHPAHMDFTTPEARDGLVGALTDRVCPPGGPLGHAVLRRATVRTIGEMVDSAADRDRSRSHSTLLDDELFCLLYRTFFADAVTEFLTSVIAAKITLVVPGLVLVDPSGQIAAYITGKVAEQIPTPCMAKAQSGSKDPVTEIAADLVHDTFDRWLETAGSELP